VKKCLGTWRLEMNRRVAVLNSLNIRDHGFVFVVLWFRTTWLR
jgi:hypothetical protein